MRRFGSTEFRPIAGLSFVYGGARLKAFEVGAADHCVEEWIAKAETQQVGLIRNALNIETGPVGLVQVELAVLVDVAAVVSRPALFS